MSFWVIKNIELILFVDLLRLFLPSTRCAPIDHRAMTHCPVIYRFFKPTFNHYNLKKPLESLVRHRTAESGEFTGLSVKVNKKEMLSFQNCVFEVKKI